MRALIVADSRANRVVIGRCLSDLGFQAVAAADAFEALTCVKNGPPFELVMADLKMRGMNGLDFVRQLRATPEYQTTSIILICSASALDTINTADEAGPNEYMVKPFSREALVAKLDLLGISTEKSQAKHKER